MKVCGERGGQRADLQIRRPEHGLAGIVPDFSAGNAGGCDAERERAQIAQHRLETPLFLAVQEEKEPRAKEDRGVVKKLWYAGHAVEAALACDPGEDVKGATQDAEPGMTLVAVFGTEMMVACRLDGWNCAVPVSSGVADSRSMMRESLGIGFSARSA